MASCECFCGGRCPDQPVETKRTVSTSQMKGSTCPRPAAYLFAWTGFTALELCAECVARRRTRKAHLEHLFSVRSLAALDA